MINIAVLGYGTVGSGVVEVLDRNKDVVGNHAGQDINVKYVLDLRDFPGDPVQEKIVHDFDIIVNDPEVKIVVEVMGGVEPAFTFTKKALEAGKSVVTSNKELVARHGAELLCTARKNNINFLFEASVGGGIPIIRPLYSSLTADHITEILGIVNGTTNYILTKMFVEGAQFEDVLSQAQALGYAERNPSADVDGFDAGRKIAILSSLTNDKFVHFEDVYTEGITKITADDFVYIKKLNQNVKLLAYSKKTEEGLYCMVSPFLLDSTHPLYNVHDVFNAVYVKSDMLGETMYYGKGAGKLPTASAVVSDVVDAARHLNVPIKMNLSLEGMTLLSIDNFECPFFVRVKKDRLEDAKALLPVADVIDAGLDGEIAVITDVMSQKAFADAAAKLDIITRIRIYR